MKFIDKKKEKKEKKTRKKAHKSPPPNYHFITVFILSGLDFSDLKRYFFFSYGIKTKLHHKFSNGFRFGLLVGNVIDFYIIIISLVPSHHSSL